MALVNIQFILTHLRCSSPYCGVMLQLHALGHFLFIYIYVCACVLLHLPSVLLLVITIKVANLHQSL